MLRRTHLLWVGMAIYGLSIGLPLWWGFSQFHASSAIPRETAEKPAQQAATYIIQEPEGWGAPLVILTGVLCVITGCLARYTYRLFRATSQIARESKAASDAALKASTDELALSRASHVATNRAWIHSPEIRVGFADLRYFPADRPAIGVTGAIAVRIINVGNAPATHLTIHAWLLVGRGAGTNIAAEQKRLTDEIRASAFQPGRTLFPKEVYPDNIHTNIEHVVQVGADETRAAMAESEDGKQVVLYVVGCIDYTFPADPATHHQTGFIRQLRLEGPYAIRPLAGGRTASNLLDMRHAPIDLLRPPD